MNRFLTIAAIVFCFVNAAHAQSLGMDFVNQEMVANGLFTPHKSSICDLSGNEAFVPVGEQGEQGSNPQKGFCIEKTERTAASWAEARQHCAEDGKRLPEPTEFLIACNAAPSGVVDLTDDPEWITNFPFALIDYWGGSYLQMVTAWVGGSGACNQSETAAISLRTSLNTIVTPYRCVR